MVEGKTQELEPKKEFTLKRELSVWIFRHGDWDYKTDVLSEKGEQEAKGAGKDLFKIIGNGEVVKFLISPKTRTLQTAAIMQETLGESLEQSGQGALFLGTPRTREVLKGPGFDWEYVEAAVEAGVPIENLLEYWYEVDDWRGKVETPRQVQERLMEFLFRLGRVVSRLPEGPKVNLVLVSHGEVPGTLLKEAFGRTGLPTCEWVRFDFGKGEIEKIKMVTYDGKSSEVGFKTRKE